MAYRFIDRIAFVLPARGVPNDQTAVELAQDVCRAIVEMVDECVADCRQLHGENPSFCHTVCLGNLQSQLRDGS